MMPLIMAAPSEDHLIKKVGGQEETRQFLATLGFVPGAHVAVVSATGGDIIVRVKESRVAISREMALKIMI